jgi:DNA polymerase-3 subunit epsilon
MSQPDFETMAAALDATGEYRVLRKLKPRREFQPHGGAAARTALFVDVETTGLDPERNEIIELAMVPFTYGADGRIFTTGEPFQGLRKPNEPIPVEITAITGIDDAMVAGKSIDRDAVVGFIESADLIIAHNASFDRRFLERFCPAFAHKPWACSNSQIDWKGEGFEGTRLAYLVAGAGYFYGRHRALNDCYAAIELLATQLPRSGALVMASLLERARVPTWRIWASHAPYDLKDTLKARGYRWNGDGHGPRRAWFIDVLDNEKTAELHFLETEIYRGEVDIPTKRIDAFDRFSDRA